MSNSKDEINLGDDRKKVSFRLNDQRIKLIKSSPSSKSKHHHHHSSHHKSSHSHKADCSKDHSLSDLKSKKKKKSKHKEKSFLPTMERAESSVKHVADCLVAKPSRSHESPSNSVPAEAANSINKIFVNCILEHINQNRQYLIEQLKKNNPTEVETPSIVKPSVPQGPRSPKIPIKYPNQPVESADCKRFIKTVAVPGIPIPGRGPPPVPRIVYQRNKGPSSTNQAMLVNQARNVVNPPVTDPGKGVSSAKPQNTGTIDRALLMERILKAKARNEKLSTLPAVAKEKKQSPEMASPTVTPKNLLTPKTNGSELAGNIQAEVLKRLVNAKELSKNTAIPQKPVYRAPNLDPSRSTQEMQQRPTQAVKQISPLQFQQAVELCQNLLRQSAKPSESIAAVQNLRKSSVGVQQLQQIAPNYGVGVNQSPHGTHGVATSPGALNTGLEAQTILAIISAANVAKAVSAMTQDLAKSSQVQKVEELRTRSDPGTAINLNRNLSRDGPKRSSSCSVASSRQSQLEPSAKRQCFTPRQVQMPPVVSRGQITGPPPSADKPFTRVGVNQDSCDVEMLDVSADLQSLDVLKEAENKYTDSKSFCIVIDTNVLMHDLKLVDELKDIPLQGLGSFHIVIPWVVIQELDRLKSRTDKKKYNAVEAVRYLYNMLNTKHPRFHGQTAKMAAKCKKSYDECNDDMILGCCLQLAEKMPKERIILLSNDINLCNKAIINEITAHTVPSLRTALKSQVDGLQKILFGKSTTVKENAGTSKNAEEKTDTLDSKKEVDFIMCEAKMLLKFALEPVLKEALTDAFGDIGQRLLPDPPAVLYDILNCYKRFWVSVFGLKLPQELKGHLENLAHEFPISRGYLCDAKTMLSTLKDAKIFCEGVSKWKPSVEPSLKRLSVLIDRCQALLGSQKPDEVEAEEMRSGAKKKEETNAIVLAVFNHLWALISHLCGLILKFAGIPHEFVYNEPAQMPSRVEFQLLLSNLYPQVHKLRKSMVKLLRNPSKDEKENDKEFRCFYNYLLQFVPSLEIQASPPPIDNFTVETLKNFFKDHGNKEILQNGVGQLETFYSKLNECIQHSIWKGGIQNG